MVPPDHHHQHRGVKNRLLLLSILGFENRLLLLPILDVFEAFKAFFGDAKAAEVFAMIPEPKTVFGVSVKSLREDQNGKDPKAAEVFAMTPDEKTASGVSVKSPRKKQFKAILLHLIAPMFKCRYLVFQPIRIRFGISQLDG